MQLFTNNADSELNGAIASGTLSITLKTGDGSKFPSLTGSDFFLVTLYQKVGAVELNHEIIKCTARAGDVLTVVRAQEGTTAKAFNHADPVELRITAGSLAKDTALIRSLITTTTQSASTGFDYWLANVAATTVTAPTAVDGARFRVTPVNGLLTNVIDFGSATALGYGGNTAAGLITMTLGAPMEFEYSTTIGKWVMA